MENKNFHVIFQRVAKVNNVSIEEVMTEISLCIDVAIDTAQKENNRNVMGIWKSIPCVGDKPTPAELLAFLAEKTRRTGNGPPVALRVLSDSSK